MDQNHLGKFLKLNSLEYPLIEYQLFNFSKEKLKTNTPKLKVWGNYKWKRI